MTEGEKAALYGAVLGHKAAATATILASAMSKAGLLTESEAQGCVHNLVSMATAAMEFDHHDQASLFHLAAKSIQQRSNLPPLQEPDIG